ncbi:hypothetical protein L917_07369 [Phytophthora nicotianae]|uniref:Uncharacterized protein n=1 Tax=Phytophthora nicotianae TaxID=4792 RepID=W2LBH6_PHYNI|nr:hypothetical protein L917_07369 [Phytophthora nicotianae]
MPAADARSVQGGPLCKSIAACKHRVFAAISQA